MSITFSGNFSILCLKFSAEVPTQDPFFCSPCWLVSFPGGYPPPTPPSGRAATDHTGFFLLPCVQNNIILI